MAVDFGNVRTDAGITKLNDHMASHSYVVGFSPTQQDTAVFSKMLGAPCSKFAHAARWYRHIGSFTQYEREHFPGQISVAKKNEDDDFDLFGEETPEEAAAQASMKAAPKKEAKKPVINKSQLVIDIKPSSVDTDLKLVEKMVRDIKMEGLDWSITCKVLPVAFGLMKIQIGCNIVDDLINTDDIIAKIECIGLDEKKAAEKIKRRDVGDSDDEEEEDENCLVQSAEIVSFNKL